MFLKYKHIAANPFTRYANRVAISQRPLPPEPNKLCDLLCALAPLRPLTTG
jgi:hypothetical protein